jgi:transcription termination/antitermination protein NusG
MTKNPFVPNWYVLHTRSRFENVVNDGLYRKALDVFLPKHQVPSKRRDRRVVLRVPLFPGYVFVKTDLTPDQHISILKTVGVVRIVGNKDGPLSVPEDTIESLRIMVTGDQTVTTGKRFRKGDKVIVLAGPFTGVTGFFLRYRGKGRVVINLEALGQYAGVDVEESEVEVLPSI